jgi:hypothetical protein
MNKKYLMFLLLFVGLLNSSIALQGEYSNTHWSIKEVEKINKTSKRGLTLNYSEFYPKMAFERYKMTSKYLNILHYTNSMGKNYLAISVIDNEKKLVLSSFLLKISIIPEKISIDINSYDFISKNIVFGVILDISHSESIDFFSEKILFIYQHSKSGIKPLLENIIIEDGYTWRGGGCVSGNRDINMTISPKIYSNEYPQLVFIGENKISGLRWVNENDRSNCYKLPTKKGKYKVVLAYSRDNRYKIIQKIVYVNNSLFKNFYQIGKHTGSKIQDIINVNPRINSRKLRYGETIILPENNGF